MYYSGQLVDRGGGRYSATLHHNLYEVPPLQYQFEVMDCTVPVTRFPSCLHNPPVGPIELHVKGDYGYEDMYHRLKCGGDEVSPDLPPKSDPYAKPCD